MRSALYAAGGVGAYFIYEDYKVRRDHVLEKRRKIAAGEPYNYTKAEKYIMLREE